MNEGCGYSPLLRGGAVVHGVDGKLFAVPNCKYITMEPAGLRMPRAPHPREAGVMVVPHIAHIETLLERL